MFKQTNIVKFIGWKCVLYTGGICILEAFGDNTKFGWTAREWTVGQTCKRVAAKLHKENNCDKGKCKMLQKNGWANGTGISRRQWWNNWLSTSTPTQDWSIAANWKQIQLVREAGIARSRKKWQGYSALGRPHLQNSIDFRRTLSEEDGNKLKTTDGGGESPEFHTHLSHLTGSVVVLFLLSHSVCGLSVVLRMCK